MSTHFSQVFEKLIEVDGEMLLVYVVSNFVCVPFMSDRSGGEVLVGG